ncbi:ATP-binding protein [Ideonella sp.]|uniref:ATP-binding protein n=1 Tax=Ideonella sp. TaxID=1929293 RepID=UPI0035B1184D
MCPPPGREDPRGHDRDELLELAIEAADVGLWDVNLLTQELYWPPRVRAMFGIPADAPITLDDFYRGVHPDDRQEVLAAFHAAQDGQVRLQYDVEYRTVGKFDHQVRWVAAKGRGQFDAQGRCVRILGTAVDITARRHAEQQHRDALDRLRLLDRIGDRTRELTDAAEIMQATARLLGEHLGATRCAYADVEPDNDRFTIRSDWSAPGVPSSAGVYSLDLFGPLATSQLRQGLHLVVNDVDAELGDEAGGRMFNSIGIKAVICAGLVKQGRLVALMAVHQDRPRRWSGQDIQRVTEVVERCWAHIERVRDAAMLREQDRHKDEFLATLAHELRNPIAPMRYAAALLKLSQDPGAQAQAQQVIERQAGHIARLIDDLMDVSRINRGLIELKRTDCSVAAMVRQAAETARPMLDAARHRLRVQLPDPALHVDADPDRIVQVFTNLLNNAAKYTPDGGDVRIAAWAEGRQAVVEVSDNGVGIPPQDQGRLFRLFTQLPHTGHRSQGGLGIGLSLVKSIVDLHGGRVSVASGGLDQGSTFRVELPRVRGAGATPASTPDASQSRAEPGGRILVAEDNPDGLSTLLRLLQAHGYEARGVDNGAEALELAGSWQPDLLLLDLGLPGMRGDEVARRLQMAGRPPGMRVLALTGWGSPQDRERTRAAGFDAHLTKPVDPQELLKVLATWRRRADATP